AEVGPVVAPDSVSGCSTRAASRVPIIPARASDCELPGTNSHPLRRTPIPKGLRGASATAPATARAVCGASVWPQALAFSLLLRPAAGTRAACVADQTAG